MDPAALQKKRTDAADKIRDHLRKAKAATLMIAHTQAQSGRQKFLRVMSDEMKAAMVVLEKLEKT